MVDDEVEIRESLEALLDLEGYQVDLAANAAEGERKLESRAYDLVLLDLMMPDKSGMEMLRDVRERDRHTPIFMITAYGTLEAAVQAVKLGANDYLAKPWDNEKLLIEIGRVIAGQRLIDENTQLKRALKQRYSFPNIVGKSDRMLRVLDLVMQVAAEPFDDSDHRRNRHRQGADRQGDSRQFAARRACVSSPSTAVRCPPICWNPRCSAT